MLHRLLPPTLDNTYRGHRLGLWLFVAILIVRALMSANAILNGRRVAMSADGIPLDTFPDAASQAIVAFFALLGLSRLMSCILGLVALVRYKSMVPLGLALFTVEHVSRYAVLAAHPVTEARTPVAFAINTGLLVAMLVALAASLTGARSTGNSTA